MRLAWAIAALLVAGPAFAGNDLEPCEDFSRRSAKPWQGLREFRSPGAGATVTAEVGRPMMISAEVGVFPDKLILKSDYAFAGEGRSHRAKATIPAGTYRADPDGSAAFEAPGVPLLYKKNSDPFRNSRIGLLVPGWDQGKLHFYFYIGTGFRHHEAGIDPSAYEITYCLAPPMQPRFQSELVYTGRSQNTVTVLYREYANDLARPAFTQELRYDLAEPGEVGFRGARFEIVKATNTEITFRVIRPLS